MVPLRSHPQIDVKNRATFTYPFWYRKMVSVSICDPYVEVVSHFDTTFFGRHHFGTPIFGLKIGHRTIIVNLSHFLVHFY